MSKQRRANRARDLLADVRAAGGCLDVNEWRELYQRHGYRNANGFFGTQWPAMFSVGSMRCLTAAGRERAIS